MSKSLQKLLWDAPPSSANEFIPGPLSICMEAVVCGWDESVGPLGQRVLDTLFVRLVKPPRKIADMPENVVPFVGTSTHLTIVLSDDTLLSVVREHVVCLLSFGMTDYTSQAKSRPKIQLNSLNATIVVLTMWRYREDSLRKAQSLCRDFQLQKAWKTNHRDPAHFHPAMRWNASMRPRVPDSYEYSEWKPSINAANTARERVAPTPRAARARPRGLIWDPQNWSCTFTILGNIFLEDATRWEGYMRGLGLILTEFVATMRRFQPAQ
ncbi:hypothetical protein B0H13DRAFT_1856638 [Mycena leptocephala]|nr:hypothetical protein B0H13DRAFT_1856638 [Mycena leptocephala]